MDELKGIDIVCIMQGVHGMHLINDRGNIAVSAYETKKEKGLTYVKPIHDMTNVFNGDQLI